MRIRNIIRESLMLPFKELKLFIIVFLLAFSYEVITDSFYHINIGDLSIVKIIINMLIILIIMGIMMHITHLAVYDKKVEIRLFDSFMEGVREYVITMYYLVLTLVCSSFFIFPTGVYSKIYNLINYIKVNNADATFITIQEISHELPIDIMMGLQRSIEINLIITIVILIVFSSFGFIGKSILFRTDNLLYALDLRVILKVIKNIGYKRYVKFLIAIGIILIIVINIIIVLGQIFGDFIISALLETFLLFFATNAFYLIYEGK
ncbi:MAG: hypothetical protein IJJ47_03585 [Methanosphaera sp.]|nr:hypothetical protein [Methanosphaera sp.]